MPWLDVGRAPRCLPFVVTDSAFLAYWGGMVRSADDLMSGHDKAITWHPQKAALTKQELVRARACTHKVVHQCPLLGKLEIQPDIAQCWSPIRLFRHREGMSEIRA